jgi:pyruvate dehydrogenase E2 component (dihydrolipoamide acetyltransferase)
MVRQAGTTIKLDDNLVSMETAKAVVDVPSPFSGKVINCSMARRATSIETGAACLLRFEIDAKLPQRAEAEATGHHHGPRNLPSPNRPNRQRHLPRARRAAEAFGCRHRGRRDAGRRQRACANWPRSPSEASRRCPPCARPAKKLGVDI